MEAFRIIPRLGVDVEVEGPKHGTTIMEAAAHGRLELVKLSEWASTVYMSDDDVVRNPFSVSLCRAHPRVRRDVCPTGNL